MKEDMLKNSRIRHDLLGILGGMGPLATADFLTKLISYTPASKDADHIPVVISSEPQIPPRIRELEKRVIESPLQALLDRRNFLLQAGVRALVMPCNTAHYWYDDLISGLDIPFFHIVDSVIEVLNSEAVSGITVGLLATKETINGRLYENSLKKSGFGCIVASSSLMRSHVIPGIALVKKNKIYDAQILLRDAVGRMLDNGADKILLGCSELPVCLDMKDPFISNWCIDPTTALAKVCIDWAKS
jgi:aspartate racemase